MASEPSEWAMRKAKVLDEVGCGVCDDHSQVQDPDNPEEGALINDPTGCTWAFSCARLRAVATVLDSARAEGVKDALDRAADRVRGWEFKDGTTGDLAACFRVPCAICGIAIYEGRWIREKGKYYCSPRCHSQAGPPVQADGKGGA